MDNQFYLYLLHADILVCIYDSKNKTKQNKQTNKKN